MTEERNDFDRLAYDIIRMVTGDQWVADTLIAKVSARLQHGPQITMWPKDIAEASQRARDAARAREAARVAQLPTLPRPVVAPQLPQLPRVMPTLPRPVVAPVLPPLPRPIVKG